MSIKQLIIPLDCYIKNMELVVGLEDGEEPQEFISLNNQLYERQEGEWEKVAKDE